MERRPSPRIKALLNGLLVFLLLLACVATAAWLTGGLRGDIGASPDEPSHVMNALLVRDYLASGMGRSPWTYALDYYVHYPKVAIGIWGPVHPLMLGLWALVVSDSVQSILSFGIFVAALVAFLSYWAGRQLLPTWAALFAGVLVALSPLVLATAHIVGIDLLLAVWSLGAAIALGRSLDRGRTGDFVLFASLAVAGAMTKVTGIALFGMPFVAIALTSRMDLLRRWAFWLPLLGALTVVLPFQWVSTRLVLGTVALPGFGMASVMTNLRLSGVAIWSDTGPWFLALVVVGCVTVFLARLRGVDRSVSLWASLAALIVVEVAFCSLQTHPVAPRYLAVVSAPLMLLAMGGLVQLTKGLPLVPSGVASVSLALAACSIVFATTVFRPYPRVDRGLRQAAAFVLSRSEWQDSRLLVSGSSPREGGFVAEVALAEHRPSHVVLRASKILSSSTWDGKLHVMLYESPNEAMARLQELVAGVLVVIRTEPVIPEEALVRRVVAVYPERWHKVAEFGGGVEIYELQGHQTLPKGDIQLDLSHTLGKTVRSGGHDD